MLGGRGIWRSLLDGRGTWQCDCWVGVAFGSGLLGGDVIAGWAWHLVVGIQTHSCCTHTFRTNVEY